MSGLSGSRFTSQNQTTNQRLSTNTVGLVALSDFRKRRAEVLEQQEREAREAHDAARAGASSAGAASGSEVAERAGGSATPGGTSGSEDKDNGATASDGDGPQLKKKKKAKKDGKKSKGVTKLSFMEGEEEEEPDVLPAAPSSTPSTSSAPSSLPPLKSFTKAALRRQAAEREALRKEFLQRQAAVKATDVAIPFVFYEGTDIPGGVVRVKKGDHVWLFLDRSRKVGARLGVGEKKHSKARLHWARVGVDDLMLVRGNLILPHHYDFYYFIINKTVGPGGVRVFDYSAEPSQPAAATATPAGNDTAQPSQPSQPAQPAQPPSATSTPTAEAEEDYSMFEGANDDPSLTKVVDRRWYERNKHIYPANVWQEFDPEQDYTQQVRRDQGGNAYFFAAK